MEIYDNKGALDMLWIWLFLWRYCFYSPYKKWWYKTNKKLL